MLAWWAAVTFERPCSRAYSNAARTMRSEPKREIDIIDFFFNDTATTEIYTLSLHDALPISIVATGAATTAAAATTTTDTGRGSGTIEIGRAHV